MPSKKDKTSKGKGSSSNPSRGGSSGGRGRGSPNIGSSHGDGLRGNRLSRDKRPEFWLSLIRAQTTHPEGYGSIHWGPLYAAAQEAITAVQQDKSSFLHRLFTRHVNELPYVEGEDDGTTMTRLIVKFAEEITSPDISLESRIRLAIIFLNRSGWDLQAALDRFYNPRMYEFITLEESSEEERNDEEPEHGILPPDSDDSDAPIPDAWLELKKLNKDIDRSPATKGKTQPSKFSIIIKGPDPKVETQKDYGRRENFDWNDPKHIQKLNKWRSQIFYRQLGKSREARVPFHQVENKWLIDLYESMKREAEARGEAADWHGMRWDEITDDFNSQFEGEVLPGSIEGRPQRKTHSLISQRSRIPEICEMAGYKLRSAQREAAKRQKGHKDPEGDAEDESDEDEPDGEEDSKQGESSKKPQK